MKQMKLLVFIAIFGLVGLLGTVYSVNVDAVDVSHAACDTRLDGNGDELPKPDICSDLSTTQACTQEQRDQNEAACDKIDSETTNPLYGPDGIITRAAGGLSLVIGVIAVIIIIISGIRMTLSSGDAGKVNQARDGIIYSAVGLIIAVLAQAIVRFVLSKIE